MTSKGSSVEITNEVADMCDQTDQFSRFDDLFRKVISVPKALIEAEEIKFKAAKSLKKRPA